MGAVGTLLPLATSAVRPAASPPVRAGRAGPVDPVVVGSWTMVGTSEIGFCGLVRRGWWSVQRRRRWGCPVMAGRVGPVSVGAAAIGR